MNTPYWLFCPCICRQGWPTIYNARALELNRRSWLREALISMREMIPRNFMRI